VTIQRTPTLTDNGRVYRIVFYRYEQAARDPVPADIPADAKWAGYSNIRDRKAWTYVREVTPDHPDWKATGKLPVVRMPGGSR
jgi:hypothetical protein